MSFKVDIHTHVIPRGTLGGAGAYGPELAAEADGTPFFRIGKYKLRAKRGNDSMLMDPRFYDPQLRLVDMDRLGIDAMGVSISPLTYMYWIEPEIAVPFAALQNDEMATYCAADPNRLFFFATLPLQDVAASVAEVDRVATKLGARGLNIGQTDVALGKFPDDPSFWRVYERAEQHGLPILVHPYPPGIERGTGENQLEWMAGYVHQSTISGAAMVLGGVFDAFPKLKVILPHGGGSLPYQWGRFAYAAKRMPGVKAKRKHELDDYLRNLYFDCLVHDVKSRRFLVDFAGPDHVLVGDNYLGWDAMDGFSMVEELGLPKAAEEKILGLNAAELFKLHPSA